jgi:lambda repressor-like predicted transcriptional regulator
MPSVTMNPEAVKAAIRIKHGSMEAFAATAGLKSQAVRDFLRGQSARAKPAVAELLGVDPDHLVLSTDSTNVEIGNTSEDGAHRLNAEAR